jgi:serine/threonine-protein kinase
MINSKVEDFADLVRRSGLVEPEQLERAILQLKEEIGAEQPDLADRLAARLVEAGLLTAWQSENLLRRRYKGFFLKGKQYKLLDHLGSGGMSHVYLAEHVLMQRRVAIKVLPKNRVKDSSYLARFHREAQAVAALDHRNIVRAYDVDHEEDVHFLVMEYVEGRDLQAIVRDSGPLDYARATEYVRQAAEGLEHAHRAGLIHRDVKPANLLVDRSGVVKLLDLGLARFTGEDQASLTVAYDENVLGTADYLAPEQAIDSHGVDARADIYSLGCSFYFLLTGHPPYPDGTLPQRLMMHHGAPPPDVRDERADAPEDLVEILKRMMAKKPAGRYQSAREVAEALAAWLKAHGHDVLGQPEPLAQTPAGSDARSKLEHATAKAPGSGSDRGSGSSARKTAPLKETLPVAERIDEEDVLGDILGGSAVSIDGRIEPASSISDEQLAAYRQRRQRIPGWLWGLIAAGAVLALVLLVATILLSQ